MDRRLCLQALNTVTATACLPCAAFAEIAQLPPEFLSISGDNVPVQCGQTVAPDPLYAQAVAIVLGSQKASVSLVQCHLRLGYKRAAGLLALMAQAGLISTHHVHGYRQILTPTSA